MKILTTRGEIDEELLDKRTGDGATEYRLHGEIVHRSSETSLTGADAVAKAKLLTERSA